MTKKPNIIFILTDDQGAWAMNCAGTKELHTPNLNKIAKNGMMFDNFFCASPVCSPARASLLTGTIPSAHGVLDWLRAGNIDAEKFKKTGNDAKYIDYSDEHKPIQYLAGQTCYTDLLVANGYTCALSGKWHLGDSITLQHGFSKWYTIGKGGCNYFHPDIVEDGKIEVRHDEYITDLITDHALGFIDELVQKDDPFYISVHYTAPHSPWEECQHPKEYIDMYDTCKFESIPDVPDHPNMTTGATYGTPQRHVKLRGYFASITAMDTGIGKILKKLDKEGIADDTIVIFTSDNGMSMGHHGIWGKGNGTSPMNMYDTAVKVPFLISYPRLIEKGVTSNEMVSAYDLFPTLVDLLAIKTNTCARLPGKSFARTLKGEKNTSCDDTIVIFDEYGPVRMIRSRNYKYVHRYPFGYHEFYDLLEDPNEEVNLIDDKNYANKILSMRRNMEEWFNHYVNPDVDGSREGVTGSGQLCSAGIYAEQLKKYYPL